MSTDFCTKIVKHTSVGWKKRSEILFLSFYQDSEADVVTVDLPFEFGYLEFKF